MLIALVVALIAPVVTTTPTFALADPSSVTAESLPGTGSITVKWALVSGADRYRVRVGIGTNANNITVKTQTVTDPLATKFTFSGLEFNISYTVSVQAGDGSTWSTRVYSVDPVTLKLTAPTPPAQPSIRAIDNGVLVVEWSEPTENGGAEITSYAVQIYKGATTFGEPQATTSRVLTAKTADSASTFSATVVAINAGGIASKESRRSEGLMAVRPANNTLTRTPAPSPVVPIVPAPSAAPGAPAAPNSAPNQASPNKSTTPTYTRNVNLKSTTTSKSLASLGKLSTPKGSRITVSVPASSRKICVTRGTSIVNLKRGTCSVKVTVTTKNGKKSSRTVKLVIR